MANLQVGTQAGADNREIKNDPIMSALLAKTPSEIITHLQSITDPEERWDYTMRAIVAVSHLLQAPR